MLKCPTCGEHSSEVKLTRKVVGGTRRKRKCFNGHTFFTIELAEAVVRATRKLRRHDSAIERRRQRFLRDMSIVRMVRRGVPKAEVAAFYGIAATTVTHVLGKHAPELKRPINVKRQPASAKG